MVCWFRHLYRSYISYLSNSYFTKKLVLWGNWVSFDKGALDFCDGKLTFSCHGNLHKGHAEGHLLCHLVLGTVDKHCADLEGTGCDTEAKRTAQRLYTSVHVNIYRNVALLFMICKWKCAFYLEICHYKAVCQYSTLEWLSVNVRFQVMFPLNCSHFLSLLFSWLLYIHICIILPQSEYSHRYKTIKTIFMV